jgi:gliding motility-associated-like protein
MKNFTRTSFRVCIVLTLFLTPIFYLSGFAQGGETAAAATGSPIGVPFSGAGSTIGAVDDYNGPTGFPSWYTTGPDWLYYFCATADGNVVADVNFTPDPDFGVWASISIWDGVPNGGGNLVSSSTQDGYTSGSLATSFAVTNGSCYYIMIDNWPDPQGFDYTFDLFYPPTASLQPSCTNIGYENGDFTGWFGTYGYTVTTGDPGDPTPKYSPTTYNTNSVQHSITTGGVDPICGIPQVCPGQGPNSMMLGDADNAGYGGATIEQKFSVTAANALFTYYYAVVITDAVNPVYIQSVNGGDSTVNGNPVPMPNWNNTGDSLIRHASEEQPFFKVDVYDCNGAPLTCGQYLVVGGPGIPGFQQVGTNDIYYKDWTPAFVDLSPYIGSCVTVKYTVADCSLGAHYCYAYIDNVCAPMIVPATTYICTDESADLTSPLTGVTYAWNVLGDPTVIGTDQTLNVSPTVNTTYECVITAATGCNTLLTFPVEIYPVTVASSTSTTICDGEAGTLDVTANPPGGTYSWAPIGGTGASMTASPSVTTDYTCTYTDPNGCTDTALGTITVNPLPPLPTVVPVEYCLNDPTIPLTATPDANCTIMWYTVATGGTGSATAPTPSSSTAGTTSYYVSQINDITGCEGPRANLDVIIHDLPTITATSATICPGESATLTASGGVSYVWDNAGETTNSITVTPASTSNFTLTGTDANNCVNTGMTTVTVSAAVVVSVAPVTICQGEIATLTASGADSYVWNTGETTATINVTPLVNTDYPVTGTIGTCTDDETATVTVNPLPIEPVLTPVSYCLGETTVPLVATADPNHTVLWYTVPTGGVGSTTAPTPSSSSAGTTTYYASQVDDVTGCEGPRASVDVIINDLPNVTVNSPSICPGESTTLTANGANTYVWTETGETTQSITVTPVASTTYEVTGTDGNGCENTAISTVTLAGVLVINVTPQTICEGETTTLTASGATSYTWNTGETTASITISPIINTNYTVSGVTGACSGDSTVTVTVNPLPGLPVLNSVTYCLNDVTVPLTGTPSANCSLIWYTVPTGGVGSATAPTPSSVSAGTTTYYASQINNITGCEGPRESVDVIVNDLPVITATSASVCYGDDATITAGGGQTYVWTETGEVTPSITVSTLSSTTYGVTGTDANNCSNTAISTVTVADELIITAAPQTICEGQSSTLTASGANSYVWSTGQTTASITVSPLVTTTYDVTGTTGSCSADGSVTVTVNPVPTVSVSNQTICNGNQATITATPSIGGGNFLWTQTSETTASISVSPSSTTIYTVQYTLNGCQNTGNGTVTVNPNPTVSVNSETICIGESSTLMATVNLNGGNYLWTPGGQTTNSITVSPTSTTTYDVVYTLNGCSGSSSGTVTVNPLPVVFAGNDVVICEGESVTLSATGANTYNWDNGVTNGVSFVPSSSGTFTVVGTSLDGCIASDDLDITVNPIPVVAFIPDDTIGCSPLTVNFDNLTANASDCFWSFGDGNTSSNCGTVTNIFTEVGCYDITLTTTVNGCTATLTMPDLICVMPDPVASFTANPMEMMNYNPVSTMINTSTGAVSYDWDFGDWTSSQEVNPTHEFPGEGGEYLIELLATSEYGCTDVAYATVKVIEDFILYVPNTFTPDGDSKNTNEIFNPVFSSGFDPYTYTLLIYNRWGEVIFESHDTNIGWAGRYGVDGQMVQDGTYTWKIIYQLKTSKQKNVKLGHVNVLK